MSEIIQVDGKSGIKIREYQGKYSLQATYNGYVNWCKPKVSKDAYSDKDRPIEVQLGDKITADKILIEILNQITGKQIAPTEDDVPF